MSKTLKYTVYILGACTFLTLFTACASIITGTNQSVSVHTDPVDGAMCSLENDKGKWYISKTPGSVVVNRSYQNLVVHCDKKGYQHTTKQVVSKTKGMVFGNVVFAPLGGVIGAGVDVADGAAYDYPADIYVPMKKQPIHQFHSSGKELA